MRYYLSLLFFFFLFFWSSRSHKEKRSSYAPEKRLRYDGIYRVEKCWRKTGIKVRCLWLFLKNKIKNHHWDNQLGLCSWWTCLLMSVFCIRDLRYVDIFLLDVTMLLPHGQGLLFPSYPSLSLSLSLSLSVCGFVTLCMWHEINSDVHGDRPRPLPVIEELNVAIDITGRKESPSWDYDVS